ncbi:GWxTD domain-containing protein [Balneolaceae bacterium ANBcel3]|nr:GWxTD domain-containing protein [Balneolaceae bacterium ANBcel3]
MKNTSQKVDSAILSMPLNIKPYIPVILLLLLTLGCGSSRDPGVRTGAHIGVTDGEPQIVMSAVAMMAPDGRPYLDISVDMVLRSLIFREDDGEMAADAILQTEVYRAIEDSEDDFARVEMKREHIRAVRPRQGSTPSRDFISYNTKVPAKAGYYRVFVTLEDQHSGKSVTRGTSVTVYDGTDKEPALTHVLLRGRDHRAESFEVPLSTYSVPGRMDTIRFEFQVYRPEDAPVFIVETNLKKFESDTAPARAMAAVTPTRGSLPYRGINYNRRETLESSRRVLEQETGVITIEYATKRPPVGNYRFEVRVTPEEDPSEVLFYKARDFASMSDHFPFITSVKDLAEPLIYLMGQREHRRLMRIEDPDSLKRAIDRYWLSNLGNKEQASRVIEAFYSRVEEANQQFSTYKEGWKTDMGLVYILFGPPWYVERSLDRMVWIYGYDRQDPRRVFYFQRTRGDTRSQPFDHYVLQRSPQYHGIEYEQIQRWLSGSILIRPI